MIDNLKSKLVNPIINYNGTDDDMIEYLTVLWLDNTIKKRDDKIKYEKMKTNINITNFKKKLAKISDNLVFRGNFACYNDNLEKEMSLTKKSINLNYYKTKELYLCLDDLIRYDSIRPELFNKIKYATLFVKHKKGIDTEPKNFRYLSNHSNIFKIIDKYWTNNIIRALERDNSLPDKNIVRNNFDRKFDFSIRNLALEKLIDYRNGKKIVLIDIQKAFDSISWDILERLLVKNLTRKTNKQFAEKMVRQYMFLNTKRIITYNNIRIDFNKSIATGLPSSTLVFSLIIEQIVYEWYIKENCKNDVIINTYVDDIFLTFKNLKKADILVKSLINYLEEFKLIVNKDKTKTNIQHLDYPKITNSDCYLGLPFADNKMDYINECINMFKKKYYNIEKNDIIKILTSDDYPNEKKQILGFFNYKLYGLNTEVNVLNILVNSN